MEAEHGRYGIYVGFRAFGLVIFGGFLGFFWVSWVFLGRTVGEEWKKSGGGQWIVDGECSGG